MNLRIRKLQEQAFLECKTFEDDSTIKTDDAFEKFAELIVRECAAICDSLQDIPATEPRHCAEDIRIHFGVEE